MKKIHYKDFEEFKDAIKPYKIIKTNEGKICFTKEYAYKILYAIPPSSFRLSKKLKSLSKLDSSLLTTPLFLIYFEKFIECVGFAMENSKDDLWSLLLNDSLNFEEKKEIAKQMKEICTYLRKKQYVHGDIKLENFLYDNGNLKLTDINHMKKNPGIDDYLRMPDKYKSWYRECKDAFYVDYLATNYCMFILLNFDLNGINVIKRNPEWCDCFSYSFNDIINSKNKTIEKVIYEKMINAFANPKRKSLTNEFLIDHLK